MKPLVAHAIYRTAAALRGEPTFSYLSRYRDSQWRNRKLTAEYHEEQLEALGRFAVTSIPYYRNLGLGGAWADFPVLSKQQLKDHHASLIHPGFRGGHRKTTGGSTGEPVTILKDSEAMAREQAGTLRGYAWARLPVGSRQARFWGVPRGTEARWGGELRDFGLNRRRFSAFDFDDTVLTRFYRRFLRFDPHYAYGYVSMLEAFAKFVSNAYPERVFPSLRAVISTSELLTPDARRSIEEGFGVRVFNEYGCGEVGTIAHECEAGRMHITDENLFVEILDEDDQPLMGRDGRVVVTELHNRAQPLIRYDLGDYGTRSDADCICGRGLGVLENIHGRAYDIVFGPNGRKYHPEFFIYIFEELKRERDQIRQFQVVQRGRTLEINLIRGPGFESRIEIPIREALEAEFGDHFAIVFNYVEAIEREASGKLRVVKRDLSTEPSGTSEP